MMTTRAAAAPNFFGAASSNHINLLRQNSRAHMTQEPRLSIGPEIKATKMVLRISVRITESLLALTLNRCKCELLTAAFCGTQFLRHPCAGFGASAAVKFIGFSGLHV